MLEVCALASGSSGNCFFVGSDKGSILVDAGISAREIERRLAQIGRDAASLQGIFITHEHSDHIRGVETLSKKYRIPVYLTEKTLENSNINVSEFAFVERDKEFAFLGLHILPFSKSHDAADPVSYVIRNGEKTASIITDIGYCCENVKKSVTQSNVLILESNHDGFMLTNGAYPKHLKDRIVGNKGHISNYEAALLVLECAKDSLSHVFLSHLSEENNKEEIALRTFNSIVKERADLAHLQTLMTYRNKPSELVRI